MVGVLQRVCGSTASPTLMNFLKVLATRGRLELLRPIARAVHQLFAEHNGQQEVEVRVAGELDPALKEELTEKVRQGLGVSIVTTSRGVMSDASARAQGVGGEVLCTVF